VRQAFDGFSIDPFPNQFDRILVTSQLNGLPSSGITDKASANQQCLLDEEAEYWGQVEINELRHAISPPRPNSF